MREQPWLKYVHWFGYLASLVVLLQLMFLGSLLVLGWLRNESRRQETMMQDGPVANRIGLVHSGKTQLLLLDQLPPLSTLSPDGLRFVAMPSFGDTYFSISLHRTLRAGEGVVKMVRGNSIGGEPLSVQTVPITLTFTEYSKLTSDLDTLSTSWNGDSNQWLDGTEVVIERVINGKVSSGFGNSPNYYGKVGAVVFDAIRPSTPQLARFKSNWGSK